MRVIAGTYRSRMPEKPQRPRLRPTSDRLRETLFNVLAPSIAGSRFVDLFAELAPSALKPSAVAPRKLSSSRIMPPLPADSPQSRIVGHQHRRDRARVDALRSLALLAARKQQSTPGYRLRFPRSAYASAKDYSAC